MRFQELLGTSRTWRIGEKIKLQEDPVAENIRLWYTKGTNLTFANLGRGISNVLQLTDYGQPLQGGYEIENLYLFKGNFLFGLPSQKQDGWLQYDSFTACPIGSEYTFNTDENQMDRGCVACAKGKYNLDFLEQCKPCNDTAELGYSEEVLA